MSPYPGNVSHRKFCTQCAKTQFLSGKYQQTENCGNGTCITANCTNNKFKNSFDRCGLCMWVNKLTTNAANDRKWRRTVQRKRRRAEHHVKLTTPSAKKQVLASKTRSDTESDSDDNDSNSDDDDDEDFNPEDYQAAKDRRKAPSSAAVCLFPAAALPAVASSIIAEQTTCVVQSSNSGAAVQLPAGEARELAEAAELAEAQWQEERVIASTATTKDAMAANVTVDDNQDYVKQIDKEMLKRQREIEELAKKKAAWQHICMQRDKLAEELQQLCNRV